jgi:aryl carrier-like protein
MPPALTSLPGETPYVLGLGLRVVPDEMIGELFVGGAGVARGYLGAAARTAIRFVPDPPGARMSRTGDLAHRRADGTLLFAGRVDDQVKVYGHRVEPGEIEAVLAGLAGVDRAAEDVTAAPYVALRTTVERVLAAGWQEVLGIEAVGLRDNSLEPGGDSISALRTVARARTRGVHISVADVLGPPSLAEVAARATLAATPAHGAVLADGAGQPGSHYEAVPPVDQVALSIPAAPGRITTRQPGIHGSRGGICTS